MPDDEHLALLRRGAAAWNASRATHDEAPDLSRAGLRGLDLTGFDLSRADLRGTNCSDANLAGAHFERANLFKAVLAGADLAGTSLYDVHFLNYCNGAGLERLAVLMSDPCGEMGLRDSRPSVPREIIVGESSTTDKSLQEAPC